MTDMKDILGDLITEYGACFKAETFNWAEGVPHSGAGPTMWTAVGGRVMIQRTEPADFSPNDARRFAQALMRMADIAEGKEPQQ
ncbi:hypothetical protein CIP107575_00760 [Corynebacterium diphtheriae]|nr:hypothetical protein CIP107575_00760 [Corynebacterium diphtheriae]